MTDLPDCCRLSLHHRRYGLSELLPQLDKELGGRGPQYRSIAPGRPSVHLHGALVVRTRVHLRQVAKSLLVLYVSDPDRVRRVLPVHVHELLRAALL
jgi:hypothetical protein